MKRMFYAAHTPGSPPLLSISLSSRSPLFRALAHLVFLDTRPPNSPPLSLPHCLSLSLSRIGVYLLPTAFPVILSEHRRPGRELLLTRDRVTSLVPGSRVLPCNTCLLLRLCVRARSGTMSLRPCHGLWCLWWMGKYVIKISWLIWNTSMLLCRVSILFHENLFTVKLFFLNLNFYLITYRYSIAFC